MKLDYGKYKGIIISIALFLLLDASVLMMNFYISFEIAEDAVGVNVAGRQRMLSQRMMKSLLDIQGANDNIGNTSIEVENDISVTALKELNSTVELFNTTFQAFESGGQTRGADGQWIELTAVTSPGSISALKEAREIWIPFYQQFQTLSSMQLGSPEFTTALSSAVAYGRANNLALLKLMNKLTVDLEKVASSKAMRLRWIQTVGITLAVINFFIIMFHFLRQLRESDRKIEAAQKETQEILDTVNEGLFLLDSQQIIGDQYSKELADIFGKEEIAGQQFSTLLEGMVSDQNLTTAKSFIRLLFDPRKKQKLIGDLNPLRHIQVHIAKTDGSYDSKHLSFSFSRVIKDGKIVHVLVTVMDISAQVRLTEALERAKAQGQEQLNTLSTIVQTNGDMLRMFLANSEKTFNEINNHLRQQVKQPSYFVDKLNQIYALIHNYKGEASSLDLDQFVDLAHQFEQQIAQLRQRNDLSGNDFLSLTVGLNRLMVQTEAMRTLVERVSELPLQNNVRKGDPSFDCSHYHSLAERIAERQGKSVEVIASGFNDHSMSTTLRDSVNSVVIQLIRNAVSHGIETCEDRYHVQKEKLGQVHVRLIRRQSGIFQLTVEDDGDGININRIREVALSRKVITPLEAEQLDRNKTVALIFHPELSTYDEADEDAGRGVGMYSVREMVKGLRGKITINSNRGRGTSIQVTFPDPSLPAVAAA